jgi:hypothetical protein
MAQSISLLKVILNSGSSPAEPWLSSVQLLDAPENKLIRDIWALPPARPPSPSRPEGCRARDRRR